MGRELRGPLGREPETGLGHAQRLEQPFTQQLTEWLPGGPGEQAQCRGLGFDAFRGEQDLVVRPLDARL